LDYLATSLSTALGMVIHLYREVLDAVGTSLSTLFTAILIAAVIGIPFGVAIGIWSFPGKRLAGEVLTLDRGRLLPTLQPASDQNSTTA